MEASRTEMEKSILTILAGFNDVNLKAFNDVNLKAFMATMVSLIDENGLKSVLRTLEAYNKQESAVAPENAVAPEEDDDEEDEFFDEMIDLHVLIKEVEGAEAAKEKKAQMAAAAQEAAMALQKKAQIEAKKAPIETPEDEDAKVLRIMRITGVDWEEAWNIVRAEELEEGASICCSEECEGNDSAISILVEAARMGKSKRNARRRAEGRSVSDDEGEDEKPAYIAPPRVRDADHYWPYARCKNIVRLIKKPGDILPRNHNGLLEYIARSRKLSMDVLKKTNPKMCFKDCPRVIDILKHVY